MCRAAALSTNDTSHTSSTHGVSQRPPRCQRTKPPRRTQIQPNNYSAKRRADKRADTSRNQHNVPDLEENCNEFQGRNGRKSRTMFAATGSTWATGIAKLQPGKLEQKSTGTRRGRRLRRRCWIASRTKMVKLLGCGMWRRR
ncbi:hypothetical protein AXF42_Ash003241 [Apostasia shenzhenica]|uniref:Uncharacterized protein n=1 Tax=Apostasia shenzhenica TaxID=1088818 RepID=A0A2I0BFK3_9ASPA|nr:hypothetical protein AXF42_Ash003241 [Apostasia shenzhenica]